MLKVVDVVEVADLPLIIVVLGRSPWALLAGLDQMQPPFVRAGARRSVTTHPPRHWAQPPSAAGPTQLLIIQRADLTRAEEHIQAPTNPIQEYGASYEAV